MIKIGMEKKKEKGSVSKTIFRVRRLVNGDIRLSQDFQLIGDMDSKIWEEHYKPKLVGFRVEYLN